MEAEGRDHRTNPEDAVPKPKDQRNLTDPESKIMKTSNKGFDQCGNAQAVANEQQIIIAANVTNQTNDVRQAIPLIEQTIENPDAAGVTENIAALTADAGYFSEDNMESLDANDYIDDVFIATGRQKHGDPVPATPKGRPPANLTAKQTMARRNRTKKGRKESARRKVISEPAPFSLNTVARSRRRWDFAILLRGLEKMQGEDAGRMESGVPNAQLVEVVQKRCVDNQLKVFGGSDLRGNRSGMIRPQRRCRPIFHARVDVAHTGPSRHKLETFSHAMQTAEI